VWRRLPRVKLYGIRCPPPASPSELHAPWRRGDSAATPATETKRHPNPPMFNLARSGHVGRGAEGGGVEVVGTPRPPKRLPAGDGGLPFCLGRRARLRATAGCGGVRLVRDFLYGWSLVAKRYPRKIYPAVHLRSTVHFSGPADADKDGFTRVFACFCVPAPGRGRYGSGNRHERR
jgi:hypothetical protein